MNLVIKFNNQWRTYHRTKGSVSPTVVDNNSEFHLDDLTGFRGFDQGQNFNKSKIFDQKIFNIQKTILDFFSVNIFFKFIFFIFSTKNP